MFNQFKRVLLSSMLLFTVLIIGACSENGYVKSSGVDKPDPDKPDPSKPVVLSFDLGTDFTIASLGDGKSFENSLTEPLKYNVNNINATGKITKTIADELVLSIDEKLSKSNSLSKVEIGTPIAPDKVAPNSILTIEIPTTITEIDNLSNTDTKTYMFSIGFNADTKLDLNFYLGNNFTIESLGAGKTFTSVVSKPFEYNVADVSSVDKSKDVIASDLVTAVQGNLSNNNPLSTVQVGDYVISGEAGVNTTLTVTIDATLKETADHSNIKNGKYTFTIGFNDDLKKWDGDTVTEVKPNGNVYEIYVASDLAWIAKNSIDTRANYHGYIVKFMADIDMGDKDFTGIKSFAGILMGNGKKIHNLNIDSRDISHIGLVNTLMVGGTIENLTIASGTVRGINQVGAFVGSIDVGFIDGNVTIKGVKNYANVTASGISVGGIVGSNMVYNKPTITIANCLNGGNIIGKENVGGIIGYADNTGGDVILNISDSVNEGNINSTTGYVGGIIGTGKGSGWKLNISGSSNRGYVAGVTNRVGGLIGYTGSNHLTITITSSINSGIISGVYEVGGLVGYCRDTSTKLNISSSSNSGKVNGSGNHVGHITGYNLCTLP